MPALTLLADAIPMVLAEVRMWYALPMIVGVSLAYAATRNEQPSLILRHAARFGGWVVVLMIVMTLLLQIMAWQQ